MLGIQAGEGAPVAWLIVHSLFNGIFGAFFLTAANALFLARFPITVLPLAYIGAAAVGYVSIMLFSRLERHVSFGVLLMVNLGSLLIARDGVLDPAQGDRRRLGRVLDVRGRRADVQSRPAGLLGAGGTALRPPPGQAALRPGRGRRGTVDDRRALLDAASHPGDRRSHAPRAAGGGGPRRIVRDRRVHQLALPRTASRTPADATRAQAKAAVGLADLLRVRYFLLMAACVVLLNLALYTIDFSFLAQVRIAVPGSRDRSPSSSASSTAR